MSSFTSVAVGNQRALPAVSLWQAAERDSESGMHSFLLDFSEFPSVRAKWARSGNSVHRSVITLPFGDRSGAAGHDGARKVCAYRQCSADRHREWTLARYRAPADVTTSEPFGVSATAQYSAYGCPPSCLSWRIGCLFASSNMLRCHGLCEVPMFDLAAQH